MRIAGIIMIVVAAILLLPMFIAICIVVWDWFDDAIHGNLLDEYSFYWFGVLFAVVFLLFGILLLCRDDGSVDIEKTSQQQEVTQ